MVQLSTWLSVDFSHEHRLVRQKQLSDGGCWQGVVPDQWVWPDTCSPWLTLFCVSHWQRVNPRACFRRLTYYHCRGPWQHGYNLMVWITWTSLVSLPASGLIILTLLTQLKKKADLWLSSFWVTSLLFSFLTNITRSSLREIFRSVRRKNRKHSLRQNWFERSMRDDSHHGNLLMFSIWSWHIKRSCCVLICGDNKCIGWVIRKFFNYGGGTRYKSCRLEAECISKTICKLNTSEALWWTCWIATSSRHGMED